MSDPRRGRGGRGNARGMNKTGTPRGPRQSTPSTRGRPTVNGGSSARMSTTAPAPSSYEERLSKLKQSRIAERANAIRNGLLADPNKPRELKDAITLVGTCQSMCPEFERLERITQNDQWASEMVTTTGEDGKPKRTIDENRMVKKFRRSAAGVDEQLPSDLRPPLVLKKTIDYLFDTLMSESDSLATHQTFIWDRTRGIRNDFSIQQLSKTSDLRLAVECYEQMARFHILSMHQVGTMSKEEAPKSYNYQQDREQFDKTLLSLLRYYDDVRDRWKSPNEPEFRACWIVFQVQNNTSDLEDLVQSWPSHLIKDPRIQHALKVYAAACEIIDVKGPFDRRSRLPIAQQNWGRFWKLVGSKQISYLVSCVAELHFNTLRRIALHTILSACQGGNGRKTEDWTVKDVMHMLAFDSTEDTRDFLKHYKIEIGEKEDTKKDFLDLSSAGGRVLQAPSVDMPPQYFSWSLVERKRYARTYTAIIKGLTVKAAREQGMIDESMESEHPIQNTTEESLFVTDDEETATQAPKIPQLNPVAPSFAPATASTPVPPTASPFAPSSAFTSAPTFASPFTSTPSTPSTSFGGFGKPSAQATSASSGFGAFGQPSLGSNTLQSSQPATSLKPSPFGTPTNGFSFPSSQGGAGKENEPPKITPPTFATAPTNPVPSKPTFAWPTSTKEPVQPSVAQVAPSGTAQGLQPTSPFSKVEVQMPAKPAPAPFTGQSALLAPTFQEPQKPKAPARPAPAPFSKVEQVPAKPAPAPAPKLQEPPNTKARETAAWEYVARQLLLHPTEGILKQYMEHIAAPIVKQAMQEYEEEKLREEADGFRWWVLAHRYGTWWKWNAAELRDRRVGRERRERIARGKKLHAQRAKEEEARRLVEEARKQAEEKPVDQEFDMFRRNVVAEEARKQGEKKPVDQELDIFRRNLDNGRHRSHTTLDLGYGLIGQPQSVLANGGPRLPPTTGSINGNRSHSSREGRTSNHRRSQTLSPNNSNYIVSKASTSTILSGASLLESRELPRGTKMSTMKSSYFTLKALGVHPRMSTPAPYSIQAGQKRARESDDEYTTSPGSLTESSSPGPKKRFTPLPEDEAWFAQVQLVSEAMGESMSLFKEFEASAQALTPPPPVEQTNNLPKFYSRTSKFLPREEYGKRRGV